MIYPELHPRCIQIQYHHCKHVQVVWALLQCFLFRVDVLSRSLSFFSSLSKIIQGDTRVRTRDLSDCRWMLYHCAVSPLHAYLRTSPQTRAGCLSTVTMFFVPIQVYSRDRCHFSLVFQKLYEGTPGFEPGTSRTATECSTTELYHRSPLHTDSIISLQTRSGCLSTVTMFFCSESSVLSRSMSFFSSLSKIIQGDTRAQTRDLSDCSRMLYHWAISPLHTDSITSLQTRSGCSSTVTMFFVPSQVYSRDQCNFFLVSQKLYKETPGFEPGTSRTAAAWSTPSYIPAAYRFNTITANTCRLFEHCYNVFCSESMFPRDRCHFSLVFQKLYKATPGFSPGTSRTADECSTTALYPRCMHI